LRTYEFLKALPEVRKVKEKPLELKRAVAQQPEAIERWFIEYEEILEVYGVDFIDI